MSVVDVITQSLYTLHNRGALVAQRVMCMSTDLVL